VSERIVVGEVLALQMRHRRLALVWYPLIVGPSIPCRMRIVPAVRRVQQVHLPQVGSVGTERQDKTVGIACIRLIKDTLARGQLDGSRNLETPHPPQGSEIGIVTLVLLAY